MAEQAFVANPILGAGGRVIASPFQFVADDDTNLMIVSVCSVTGVTLAIQGRRQDEKGRTVPFVETHAPNSDRTTKTQFYKLGKGALLNLTVFALTGAPAVGQCYVSVRIIQGFTGATVVLGTLLGGPVTQTQALGFPGSVIVSSTEAEPAVRNIIGATPAVGGNILETCPSGARWELVTVFFVFTTSPVAGNRIVFMQINSGGQPFGVYVPGVFTAALNTIDFCYSQNATVFGVPSPNVEYMAIPQRQFLRAADVFVVSAVGLDAGDQFGAPHYQVREWLEAA